MSEKHIFSDHTTLINKALKGVVALNPKLRLIPSLRVVYNPEHPSDKVAIISGGGGGHEPASSGYVGKGMLAAAVSGDIFASPSARQVLGAINAVPSKAGCILLVTNYTGDCLHFGLATQQAKAGGHDKVAMIFITDDVAVPRSTGALVGRRALAGTTIVSKLLGAASEAGLDFEKCVALGQAFVDSISSIAASLEHSHVPGRSESHKLGSDVVEIGMGVHNEPGFIVVSPIPTATDLVGQMIKLILDETDTDRSFVKYGKEDELALFVNNMGGMSVLEMNAFVNEVLEHIESAGLQSPLRIYCGAFVTTLNAPGASFSLINLTQAARETSKTFPITVDGIIEFIDAEHETISWPGAVKWPAGKRVQGRKELEVEVARDHVVQQNGPAVEISSELLQSCLKVASKTLADREPDLTKWDTIVGDGDCGETCYLGAQAVIKATDSGLGKNGDLVSTLFQLTELIDDTCGGTLGAIFSLFLAALTAEVRLSAPSKPTVDVEYWSVIAVQALEGLKRSTPARVGHRTMMDALIPFVEELAKSKDLAKAVAACEKGAQDTIPMTAKLGRATYVGAARGSLPADPGAKAVQFIVEGLLEAIKK